MPKAEKKSTGSKGMKRDAHCLDEEEVEEPVVDITSEMKTMLESFGADVSKTLSAKKRRLEQYTQSSMKSSAKKVEDVFKGQVRERKNLLDEFASQLNSLVKQWEVDLDHEKEQEEKFHKFLSQRQKYYQQNRIAQANRATALKKLYEQYTKGLEELEKCHHDQQGGILVEMKKEMSVLQKKILTDTQQQEMANMRKSLSSMLM